MNSLTTPQKKRHFNMVLLITTRTDTIALQSFRHVWCVLWDDNDKKTSLDANLFGGKTFCQSAVNWHINVK